MKKVAVIVLLTVLLVPRSFALVLPIPVTLPTGITQILGMLGSLLGIGGLAVSDAGTHASTGSIAISTAATVAEAQKIVDRTTKTLDLAKRMAEMMKGGPLPPQLRKWLPAWANDTYNVVGPWLHHANTGMPGYMQSVYPRPGNFDVVFSKLPGNAQLRAKLTYAMGELLDGIHEGALTNIGGMRSASPEVDAVIWNIMEQNFSPDESKHTTQQGLDRIGVSTTETLHGQQDIKRLLGSLVEMEVADGMRLRNTLYAAAEQQIVRTTEGPAYTSAGWGDVSAKVAGFRW